MLQDTGRFLRSARHRDDAKIILFGIPMDYTVCFRPGARFGPAHIRQMSYGLEHFSLQFGASIAERPFFDDGDLVLPFGNATASLTRILAHARFVYRSGKSPFALGGEHLVSLPLIRAAAEAYPNLHVIHIDAHADLADTYFDEPVTHATVMRRVLDFLPLHQFAQFGIRSADRPEAEYIAAESIAHFPFAVDQPLTDYLHELDVDVPLYVSIDIDVLDPAFAPGTGTPEAGGIAPNELLSAIGRLRNRRIVGCDLVETAPDLDPTGCTAVLAAKLVREMLICFFPADASDLDQDRLQAVRAE